MFVELSKSRIERLARVVQDFPDNVWNIWYEPEFQHLLDVIQNSDENLTEVHLAKERLLELVVDQNTGYRVWEVAKSSVFGLLVVKKMVTFLQDAEEAKALIEYLKSWKSDVETKQVVAKRMIELVKTPDEMREVSAYLRQTAALYSDKEELAQLRLEKCVALVISFDTGASVKELGVLFSGGENFLAEITKVWVPYIATEAAYAVVYRAVEASQEAKRIVLEALNNVLEDSEGDAVAEGVTEEA